MAVLLIVAGCSVGEVPIGGGGADGGMTGSGGTEATFNATIKPLVTTKNCVPCHSGAVQPPNFTSFATLDAKYKSPPAATNKLLIEAADGALHNGVVYFTAAEKTTITNWIMGN